MRVRVPATETHIQTTHESDFAIDETKLLVMSPVKNYIIVHAIECVQRIFWDVGELHRLQGEVLEG